MSKRICPKCNGKGKLKGTQKGRDVAAGLSLVTFGLSALLWSMARSCTNCNGSGYIDDDDDDNKRGW